MALRNALRPAARNECSSDGAGCGGLNYAFLDRWAEILRNRSAKDLIHPFKSATAFERLKYALAITKLAASAGLLFMTTLDLDRCGDRFLK